jgi:hypothetical protein
MARTTLSARDKATLRRIMKKVRKIKIEKLRVAKKAP